MEKSKLKYMELETISEIKSIATEKWREYCSAEKVYRKPEFTDLKKIYNQIKGGRKVVDIFKVIQKGGVRENHHPNLAICKASAKKVICSYHMGGDVTFNYPGNNSRTADVSISKCFPELKKESLPQWSSSIRLEAPVPLIPAAHLPKKLTDDYYVLWEVDEWKMVPPTDPYLLKRITNNIFVVLSGWDLTDLEKSVMSGRLI